MTKKPLENPSDFERALKLLDDHSSSPGQYIFNPDFGFCGLCEDITKYDFVAGPEEVYLECMHCKHRFTRNTARHSDSFFLDEGLLSSRVVIYVKDVEDIVSSYYIPKNAKEKIQRLLSREGQREMLLGILRKRVEVETNKVTNLSLLLRKAREDLFELDELLTRAEL